MTVNQSTTQPSEIRHRTEDVLWQPDLGSVLDGGRLDRRDLLRLGTGLALGASPLVAMLSGCGGESHTSRDLVAGFPDWILRLHPAIEGSVGPSYADEHSLALTQRGASMSEVLLAAREGGSDLDTFVGVTPFVDLVSLVEAKAIEPWDKYVPPAVLDDFHPALRKESTLDGKLYAWPFLLDVVIQGWNVELVQRAGLDPGRPPATWDEYIENARTVKRIGAAPYGCTFDARLWRSFVPIAHTFDADVYTDDSLFDYTHDASWHALEVMRRMYELANPDVLDPYTTAGSGATSDEGAFASQLVGYYVKYANALVRAANTWPDPSRLALSAVPTPPGGSGATTFWTTGLALLRQGANQRAAANYAQALTYDRVLWQESIGDGRQSTGQLACYRSLWNEWQAEQPPWVADWAVRTYQQLRNAAPIRPHPLGARQFAIAQPYLERYLTGEEASAERALRAAMAAVRKEAA